MTTLDVNVQCIPKHDLIEGLIKGIEVIQVFNACDPRLSVSEVAERASLSRAAARRYLLTLAHVGLAIRDGRWFRLTTKGMAMASCLDDARPVPAETDIEPAPVERMTVIRSAAVSWPF